VAELQHPVAPLRRGPVVVAADRMRRAFVAILENGVFFPGHLLLGWLASGPSVSVFAAQVYQVLSLSLSGIGLYLLLRELGAGGLGAVVAGGLWAASRDLTYHLLYIDYTDVLMCLPVLLLLTTGPSPDGARGP